MHCHYEEYQPALLLTWVVSDLQAKVNTPESQSPDASAAAIERREAEVQVANAPPAQALAAADAAGAAAVFFSDAQQLAQLKERVAELEKKLAASETEAKTARLLATQAAQMKREVRQQPGRMHVCSVFGIRTLSFMLRQLSTFL